MVSELAQKTYGKWTRELSEWLIPFVTTCENPGQARVRLLLSHIDKHAPGGQAVVASVARVQTMELNDVKTRYFAGKTDAFFAGWDDSRIRWAAIVAELENLLPAESTLSPEERLRGLKKEKTENLLDFVLRFRRIADNYTKSAKVTETRATHILFRKLPKEIQRQMCGTKFSNADLDKLEARVRNWLDWMRLASEDTFSKEDVDDYMDVDYVNSIYSSQTTDECRAENASSLRSQVLRDGQLNFDEITSKNAVMVAWKTMMREERYRQESFRFLNKYRGSKQTVNQIENNDGDREGLQVVMDTGAQDPLLTCGRILPSKKPSMHIPVRISGTKIDALIDTGASACFLQHGVLKSLGLQDRLQTSDREVVYANGVVERVMGSIELMLSVHQWRMLQGESVLHRR